ncbi:hypothetical protein [Streptomyces sp. SCSIO ZS0520]|uniref:hypothetical protein n=1 Tax=Streptomyces sp. SCSIO ZS0520 TaxID=2892996 RepID=UPI0021D96A38|nr:hypothetical protein [Streptomyces sp. SCSIO ZS0520]
MSEPMTPEQEQAIRDRAATVTPGPWTVELEQCDCCDGLCGHGTYVSAVYAGGERRNEFVDFPDEDWQFVILARTAVPALLAELDRTRRQRDAVVEANAQLLAREQAVRAERNAFADRVDTLTAVAKSNKRHVQEMYRETVRLSARVAELEARPSRAEAYRHLADELRLLQGVEPDGVKVAGLYAAELRVRRMAADAEAAEPAPIVPPAQAIADALNRAGAIGIDLDGTITDHDTWSVIWDPDAEKWAVAASEYDEEADE